MRTCKPSDVWIVSARCCTRCLHAQRLSRRFSTPTGVLGVPGPDAPLWTIDLLVATTTDTLMAHRIRLEVVQLLNLGRTVLGPNYGQRARRSSP